MALRSLVGRSLVAAASASDLSSESMARLVDEAVSPARITSPDEMGGLPSATGAGLAGCPSSTLHDARGHDLTPRRRSSWPRRCEAAALEADPASPTPRAATSATGAPRYAYATSHGFAGEYETSSFSPRSPRSASENGEMQRDSWYHVTRGARAARGAGGDRPHARRVARVRTARRAAGEDRGGAR